MAFDTGVLRRRPWPADKKKAAPERTQVQEENARKGRDTPEELLDIALQQYGSIWPKQSYYASGLIVF